MFIVSQLMTKKEKDELAQIFTALDKNGDGKLTPDELLEGYTKLYGNKERAVSEVKYLMENADADNSGYIDYSGKIFFVIYW
jgi:calcium-dependent protein kinase